MQLLIDTDIFWKLAIGNLLEDVVDLFNVDLGRCGRLAALPYMLQKGRLRKKLGAELCDGLVPKVMAMPAIAEIDTEWLEKLSQITEIDPGEAQIYAAAAATNNLIVLSSDKRALGALKSIPDFVEILGGRIVILEAILLGLCDHLGPENVRSRLRPLLSHDIMVKSCFSPGNSDPRSALTSYYRAAAVELDPLVLWRHC